MERPDFKTIAKSPGVYLFQNKKGEVLYVGKAKDLRHRLKSYFAQSVSSKIQALLKQAAHLETRLTDNELEALLLENNLIKEHRPPFNVILRDDKNYLYLKITTGEDYPRLLFARRRDDAKSRFFGPYTSSKELKRAVNLIRRLFPLCSANYVIREKDILSGKQKARACLNYHLGRCLGVCIGSVKSAEYKKVINEVITFLKGDYESVLARLENSMQTAVAKKEFEKAALFRDEKKSLLRLMEEQKIILPQNNISRDIFGLARALSQAVVAILIVRRGKLLDQKLIAFEDKFESSDQEILERALYDYYSRSEDWPREILLPVAIEESLKLWLNKIAGRKINFQIPQRGSLKQIVELSSKNAANQLFGLSRYLNKTAVDAELASLKTLFKIKRLNRIEAYDISHLAGTSAVGSMVVFLDGVPTPAHYRRFQIKMAKAGDDSAAILEILKRRFGHFQKSSSNQQDASFAARPDLILIDGGKPQLSAAIRVLKNKKIFVIALAKGGSHTRPKEDIYLPQRSKPFNLKPNEPGLLLLKRIRDEAHRFAISYQVKTRGRIMKSALEEIAGIGNETRKKLIKSFGSLASVKKASLNEIAKIIGEKKARIVQRGLNNE